MRTQGEVNLTLPVNEADHQRGSRDAKVTLIEYGDFECPHCREAHFVVKELERALADSMQFVFRNFPLTTVHPHAEQAAEAAEAAAAQGRFWPMHDTLFKNQDALEFEDLLQYAAALGIDDERFARELTERRYANRVREHFMSGVRSGVNGTPAFFINGVRHDGSYDFQSLLAAINDVV